MKRLTEKHVKKSDGHYMKCSEHCQNDTLQCGECDELDRFVDRLAAIEDTGLEPEEIIELKGRMEGLEK